MAATISCELGTRLWLSLALKISLGSFKVFNRDWSACMLRLGSITAISSAEWFSLSEFAWSEMSWILRLRSCIWSCMAGTLHGTTIHRTDENKMLKSPQKKTVNIPYLAIAVLYCCSSCDSPSCSFFSFCSRCCRSIWASSKSCMEDAYCISISPNLFLASVSCSSIAFLLVMMVLKEFPCLVCSRFISRNTFWTLYVKRYKQTHIPR